MAGNILVRRFGARGDVLLAATVVPALKKRYPGCTVYFETVCGDVLAGNPYIDHVVGCGALPDDQFGRIIDLNLAYERRPLTHILDCYAQAAEVDRSDCRLSVGLANVVFPDISNYAVFHTGETGWVGRNWQQERWNELAVRLRAEGVQVVCVGSGADHLVPCDADYRGKTTVQELATLLKGARLFVGIDSLPFHIAQAVDTPGVVFFGSVLPDLRVISPSITPVFARELACRGCHHRRAAPTVLKAPSGERCPRARRGPRRRRTGR
jgi:ADP-heptose:LPS heptosyltransferase